MAKRKKSSPVLLGPEGRPLPASSPKPPVSEPAESTDFLPEGSSPAEGTPAGEARASAESGELTGDATVTDQSTPEASAQPRVNYQVKVALDVDPRQVPAALVVLLPFDPTEAYRSRVETARDQFFKTRDTMVAAAEASLRASNVNVNDPRRAAAGMIERQFMGQIWDAVFGAVSGAQVGLVYAAALSGGERAIGTMLVSPFDGDRMWVTSRSNMIGDRFGAWAIPVNRGDQMPATVILNLEELEALRMNFARVRV